ncbi:NADH dehydrogenase [ubiquinone] 1 beta subcomplex subunit 4 [Homalodisca vitripennis]|uniref:NADH dehydrogenase [ubiquinone] 1 beta subcomplex subunit 4 n=1 Tax=Homalodisca liturata TaxID=320908 RepID=A0A1B6JCR5_9HEMI|nr:NADH dehydrogenase [ubiquinone] 1 beta subcomplex subunit 4 [Homalodisca vitripennis]
MVSEDKLKQLIELKTKQRAALKAEFVKHYTNPHRYATGEGGSIFDAGIQRWMAMEATKYNFFKPTTKNAVIGFAVYLLPVGITMYLVKTQREAKERKFRSGMVSYRDREYKFI